MGHGTGDNLIVVIQNDGLMRTATQKNYRWDNSNANALDPIITPQLSVLGRE